MLGRMYDKENCSAARALEVVGERWSLLIIRDALFGGITRFTDFQRSLGVATNVLTTRLEGFVASGLMERRQSPSPDYPEYVLTDKGRDLLPAILALSAWGDRWAAPDGPPILYTHAGCSGPVHLHIQCEECGREVGTTEVEAQPGPALRAPAGAAAGN